ncbi:hypothetical protein ABGT16_04635 [Pseudomonas asiatica]|uniref:hypothetical protein n=1 Tax=Pseudomonas TaxID=286 RepID=UPI001BAE7E83|nr:hypothetical protein [Pseudomonas putida]QUG93392.1 hypothetical protein GR140_32150 [Pseudomonas putida]
MPFFADENTDPVLPVKVGCGHLPKRMTYNQALSWALDQCSARGGQTPTLQIKKQVGVSYRHIEITFH